MYNISPRYNVSFILFPGTAHTNIHPAGDSQLLKKTENMKVRSAGAADRTRLVLRDAK
jgi:hypothetical protein